MVNQRVRTTLSVTINPQIYQRLKEEIGSRKISEFVEKAIIKELGKYDWGINQKQQQFQKKLIADYKRAGSSKNLQKEEDLWEGVIGEWLDE